MPLIKSYRVKLYLKRSGPFECVVQTTSRAKAKKDALSRARKNARLLLKKLEHELAPPHSSATPQKKFTPNGLLIDNTVVGKPFYHMKFKLTKVRPISKGTDSLLACDISMIGVVK